MFKVNDIVIHSGMKAVCRVIQIRPPGDFNGNGNEDIIKVEFVSDEFVKEEYKRIAKEDMNEGWEHSHFEHINPVLMARLRIKGII